MAKKNKPPKEKKPMSKGKKWLIALAVLVLIAIIVVVIIVCIPKNVNDVKNEVISKQETAFLVSDDDNKLFGNFQNKINADAIEYSQEVVNAKNIVLNINTTLDFYAEHIVFAQDNSTFQAEYKKILNGFGNASNYQSSITRILTEVEEKVDNYSAMYITSAWNELKVSFEGYFKAYSRVFDGLANVFVSCLGQGVISNDFSHLIVKTLPEFYDQIATDISKSAQVVNKLSSYTRAYISNSSSVITNYNYSSSLQANVKKLNQFEKIYNVSFQDVIKTANSSDFTFERIDKDTDNVLATVKAFLKGGLTA